MNRNLKIILGIALLLVILCILNARQKSLETEYPPNNLIRLHVVANSDSPADQNLKRKVRDEIVRCAAPEFLRAENVDSARLIARANLGRIQEIASLEIKSEGRDYPVEVELDSFAFPTKHYGPFMLPAGDYEAVRVVIGAGGGANWWCVLFPPLCFVDMSKEAAVSEPEHNNPFATFAAEEEGPVRASNRQSPAFPPEKPVGAALEDTPIEVEFRFKILDLFKS